MTMNLTSRCSNNNNCDLDVFKLILIGEAGYKSQKSCDLLPNGAFLNFGKWGGGIPIIGMEVRALSLEDWIGKSCKPY